MDTMTGGSAAAIHRKFFPQAEPIVRASIPRTREAQDAAVAEAYQLGLARGRETALASIADASHSVPDRPAHIIDSVCARHGINRETLLGADKSLRVMAARQDAAVRLLHELAVKTTQVGRWLKRDHSTVISLVRRAAGRRKGDAGIPLEQLVAEAVAKRVGTDG